MTKHPDILNELREIAPALSQEGCFISPYEVPEGYFHQLPASLYNLIQNNTTWHSNNLQAFQVPAGYFESFPSRMLEMARASDQPLETESNVGSLLQHIGKKMPYAVPENYFSELPTDVNAGTQALDTVQQTLVQPSLLLEQLRNNPTYQVPAGYFEQLADRLTTIAEPRVIQLNIRKRVVQWAAAAMVTGLIFAAGWTFRNTPVHGEIGNSSIASVRIPTTITDEEIQQYLEKDPTSFVMLDTVTVTAPATVQQNWDVTEMKEMLADVSDEELEQYASKNGTLLNE